RGWRRNVRKSPDARPAPRADPWKWKGPSAHHGRPPVDALCKGTRARRNLLELHIHPRAVVHERIARGSPGRTIDSGHTRGRETRGRVGDACCIVLVEGVVDEQGQLVVILVVIDTRSEVGDPVRALDGARILA